METKLQKRLFEKLEAVREKPAPLATRLGFSDSFIRDILRGKTRTPSAANLERLARALGTTADYLLGITDDDEPGEPLALAIPLLAMVSAGDLMRDDVADEALGMIRLSDLPPGDWIALKVVGESMDRISPPDSTILVNRRDRHLVPNGLYVIADEEGNATYKRYRPGPPPRFEPVSTNADLEPLFPSHDPVIIGRVKRSILDM
jgi:transcriptional regulator with XRE-family HTH domain